MPDLPLDAHGLVLGKFLPPHLGHRYLIDFAGNYVRRLTVVVGSLASEPIPGALRHRWMARAFPQTEVLHLDEELPQAPEGPHDQRFWNLWRTALNRLCPAPDFVFASEDYGYRLAQEMGARFVSVDLAREVVPISATAIRADPMGHWDRILPEARPYFLKRVAIVGPESAGKTVLARRLAAHYGTVHMAEYARAFLAQHDNRCDDIALIDTIARAQAAGEDALARQARRLLVADTETLTTVLWSRYFFGRCPGWVESLADCRTYDLYLVLDLAPYAADPQRFHPEEATRRHFRDDIIAELADRGRRWVLIGGDWEDRFAGACQAIDRLLADPSPSARGED